MQVLMLEVWLIKLRSDWQDKAKICWLRFATPWKIATMQWLGRRGATIYVARKNSQLLHEWKHKRANCSLSLSFSLFVTFTAMFMTGIFLQPKRFLQMFSVLWWNS